MDTTVASVLLMPEEIQLQILSQLNWSDLAKAACVCKTWACLVSSINCQPRWESVLSQAYPFSMVPGNTVDFVDELVMSSLSFPARPDLCIIYASSHWGGHFESLIKAFRAILPTCTNIVAARTLGVIGSSTSAACLPAERAPTEVEIGPALSISLLHLPRGGAELCVLRSNVVHKEPAAARAESGAPGAPNQDVPALRGSLPPDGSPGWHFMLLGVQARHTQRVAAELRRRYPGCSVAGGLAGTWMNTVAMAQAGDVLQRVEFEHGVVGFGLRGSAVEVRVRSIRGLKRVSSIYRVAAAVQHLFPILGQGKYLTAVETVRRLEMADEDGDFPAGGGRRWREDERDRSIVAEAVRAAVAAADSNEHSTRLQIGWQAPGDRPLQDPDSGWRVAELLSRGDVVGDSLGTSQSLLLQGALPPGCYLAFLQLRAQQARRDMEACLAGLAKELGLQGGGSAGPPPPGQTAAAALRPHAVVGGLCAVCRGRGQALYGEPGVESQLFQKWLPGVPLAGFFAGGEVGPRPFGESAAHNESQQQEEDPMLSFTSVFTLVRLSPTMGGL